MLREPAVANQFYPGDKATLTQAVQQYIPHPDTQPQSALAVVSPHAGYVYSGSVAGETFSKVTIPKDVIILGPNHLGHGAPIALMAEGSWNMPMGEVPVNRELAQNVESASELIEPDTLAHRSEHSLEVQVPFLQFLQPELSIVPLVISHIHYETCQIIGRALASAIKNFGKEVLIVASSDMTHYESRESATAKDSMAIERIQEMDPAGLYNTVIGKRITMCGIMPTTIALIAAMELGAESAELVRYTDSGETSGDTAQVVGYAGFVIS